jgi:hypothetical protein
MGIHGNFNNAGKREMQGKTRSKMQGKPYPRCKLKPHPR